jgi:hypothetical protein
MFSNKDVDNVIILYVLNYIFDVFTDAFETKTKHWIADIVCRVNTVTMTCKYNIQWSFFSPLAWIILQPLLISKQDIDIGSISYAKMYGLVNVR